MSTNDWLAQLKEGDTVAVRDGYVYCDFTLRQVERLTPTQVVVKDDYYKYRKRDGTGIGTDRRCLVEPTQEIRDGCRAAELARSLSKELWFDLPPSVLEQVNAVLESHANVEKEG